ncbi:hypothetical protein PLESTM_001620300 [Pleodorina starrii]|nr:hypothetical protein PLESTM_001620300 [Pleodorina starrii]
MSQQQRYNRVALSITVYFGIATAHLAWKLQKTRPSQARTWSTLVQHATSLWDTAPSELTVFAFLNFFVSALWMAGVITTVLFLGRLSATESQRLSHRLAKYTVFKMVFLGSVITPDPRNIAVWVAWFAVVGYLRVFLGAAKDRLESLLSSPGAQVGRHARGVCLLLLVLVLNAVSFALVLRLLPGRSLARVLLCAFDSLVVAIEGLKTLMRYAVHMADRYQCLGAGAGAAPPFAANHLPVAAAADHGGGGGGGGGGWDVGCWSGKGSFLYYAELVADVLVHVVTLAHYLHVWLMRGPSLHLIDAVLFLDMRAVLLSLLRRLRSHLSYRAATQRLNTTFRDVHPAALAATGAADCTICMDEIVHVAKQLPCGHVFHLSCLRAWLQQSGTESFTCPNCRKPILVGGADGPVDDDGGGGGQRRRESSWWLVRALDRLYVRMVVALEPLLLTLLLSITLWLGGRAQIIRRSARSSPPSPPREGFGESPGPSSTAARGGGYRTRSRLADEDCVSEDEVAAEGADEEYDDEDEYGSSDGDGDDGDGRFAWEEGLWDVEEEREGGDDGRDADSDADADRIRDAAARRRGWAAAAEDGGEGGRGRQRSGGWRGAARRMCSALGTGHGCGGCNGSHHHPSAAAAAAAGVAQHATQQPHTRGRPQQRRGERGGGGGGGAGGELGPELEPEEQPGGLGFRRRGGRAPRRGGAAAGGGEGPSGAAGARLRGRPPPSAEVPSYSGDVLVPQAAAAARRLGRTISASLRSSMSAALQSCAPCVLGFWRPTPCLLRHMTSLALHAAALAPGRPWPSAAGSRCRGACMPIALC